MKTTAIWFASVLAAFAPSIQAAAIRLLPEFQVNQLARNDDGSTGPHNLGFEVNVFGVTTTQVFVNNNGNLTIGSGLSTFTPAGLGAINRLMFAPFWADVDTRNLGSAVTTFGTAAIDGHDAFGVLWDSVGYFNAHADLQNSFQAIVISRPDTCPPGLPNCGNFDLEFNYDQIQWETGDASSGSGGLGGSSARVGYTNGAGDAFELAGSAINGAFLDGGPNALVSGSFNSNVAGRYLYEIRNSSVGTPGAAQANPVLPNQILPGPVYVFNNIRSGTWIDPAGTFGFEYEGLAGTLFSSVELPTGFSDPFSIWIPDGLGGFVVAGTAAGGTAFNFDAGGIGAFRITGINPTVNSDDPTAFPAQIFFTSATGSLSMTALFDSGSGGGGEVPEPSSYLLSLAGLAALYRMRLRQG